MSSEPDLNPAAKTLVQTLGMRRHPEGGYYVETFRAPLSLSGLASKDGQRSASTAIYFLLPAGVFSALHTVAGSDEVWHHYLGDEVEVHTISAGGEHTVSRLGPDIAGGTRPQVVVAADELQAARTIEGGTFGFSLCGCTVAPGFDFADFAMPTRAELTARFPDLGSIIEALTRVEN